jgi:putative spermidine/putrescine transport system substrate-binding protein
MLVWAVLAAGAALPAQAQKVLYLAGYGGTSENTFRQQVLPPFERAHGVRVEYVAGTSTNNLARLQAQKNRPEIDVAVLDDGPMNQAVGLGLCDRLAEAPVLGDIYEVAKRNGEGRSIGIGIVATGIAYNTEQFAKRGWPAPTSWTDLADARYKGQLLVPSISNSYGLHTLLALARAQGGSEKDIERGFTLMARRVAPNVVAFETSSSKISELFQTGAVTIGVWGSGRVQALAKSGFPVAFVEPKEGAVALLTTACPVTGSDVPELAQALVRHLLSPEVQKILAAEAGWGPTNRTVKLEPAVAATVTFGPDAVGKLIAVDWGTVNERRREWTRRWSQEVER